MKVCRTIIAVAIAASIAACGGDDVIDQTCDEVQRYQQVVPSKRVQVPEGLDPLNERAEMPIPKAKDAPVRPPGSPCIELPPSAGAGS
ncbi:MAG: hypothetical protein WBM34_08645 [Woeseiaceae bacterium]